MLKFFRGNKKETENDGIDTSFDWSLTELAKELRISKDSLRRWIKKKRLRPLLKITRTGIKIPQEIADRILGLKSNQREKIDVLEYSHTYRWLSDRSGLTKYQIKQRIRKLGLKNCLDYDRRGSRIPRSVCKMIWPYLPIHPSERREIEYNRELRRKRRAEEAIRDR